MHRRISPPYGRDEVKVVERALFNVTES